MSKQFSVQAFGISDTGRVRDENEDSLAWKEESKVFILADGMGGHASGKIASLKAIEVIESYLNKQRLRSDFEWPLDPPKNQSGLGEHLHVALRIANVRVFNAAEKDPDLNGMGTTALIFMVEDDHAVIAHVGDSRCYLYQDEELKCLTQDHSLVNQLIRVFGLSKSEAEQKAGKNVLVQSIGVEEDINPEVIRSPLADGQIYILCSDGLTDMLSEDELRSTIKENSGSLQGIGTALIQAANDAGGHDNTSVIVIAISA